MPITDKRREYLRAYQKVWIQRRREEFFHDKKCVQCGSDHNLELDHIDRTKKTSHRIWSLSKAKREAEIEKCQVLCYECHKAKTYKDMGYGNPTHGKVSTYKDYKCRCEPCRAAYSAYKKRYRDGLRDAGRPVM